MRAFFVFNPGETRTSSKWMGDSPPEPGKNIPEESIVIEVDDDTLDPNLYELVDGKLQLIPVDNTPPPPSIRTLLERFRKDIIEDVTIEPDDTILLLMLYDRLKEGVGVVDIPTYWAKLKESTKFPWLTPELAKKVEDHGTTHGIQLVAKE